MNWLEPLEPDDVVSPGVGWGPLRYREMTGPTLPDAPRFFKRVYDQRAEPFRVGRVVNPNAGTRLVIYGYQLITDDGHDSRIRREFWYSRRSIEAVCFSVKVPDTGELGFVNVDDPDVTPISEEEYLAAFNKNWDD